MFTTPIEGCPVTRQKLRRNQIQDLFVCLPSCPIAMEA